MALNPEQRDQIERQIRVAIDRLLAGQIPVGGACDVKTRRISGRKRRRQTGSHGS
ncbi:hypothetical protein ABZY81_29495 [Streptomyces sp. NPDC006514]|uniref:hypothetical protein n=1 Tax=Streptomyces sp. NPDC006514 TaxID=3154308 RepID=UPI0033B4A155